MPSGQDVPDVEDFNSNAEIIDNTLFKHITNTADAYEKKIYKAGERCIKYDTLWKAKNDIDEPEEWTEEHWEKTTIDKEIEESSEKVYVGAFSSFPEIGKYDAIYVDNSVDPALIYYWDGEKYSPAGGTGGGGGTGENAFDVTFTLATTEWEGASSPYSQVISVPGIYQNKAIVYAMQSEDAQPTEKEKVEYAKITGISQNTDSVTFYAAEKPTADIVIRAFSGADTEQAADLSIIAAPFDAGSSYLADDYTLYEGQMYKFTENKDPGAWDTSKVTLTTVSDELKSQAAELASQAEDIADLNSRLKRGRIDIVSGIQLDYNGYLATLYLGITAQSYSEGWNIIGKIPESYRPSRELDFVVADNLANSATDATPILSRIDSDGNIKVYAYSDKTRFAPDGSVTYILD